MKNLMRGKCTIRVSFHSKPEYDKFRIYVLKTKWETEAEWPGWENLEQTFKSYEDVERIVKIIFSLLQLGFEVQWVRFQPEEELASEEHPTEEDNEVEIPENFDLQKMCDDLWRMAGGKNNEKHHRTRQG